MLNGRFYCNFSDKNYILTKCKVFDKNSTKTLHPNNSETLANRYAAVFQNCSAAINIIIQRKNLKIKHNFQIFFDNKNMFLKRGYDVKYSL